MDMAGRAGAATDASGGKENGQSPAALLVPPATTLLTLPTEVLLAIFGYLQVRELSSACLVCKHLCLVAQDDILWKSLFFYSGGTAAFLSPIAKNKGWKKRAKDQMRMQSRWRKGEYTSLKTFNLSSSDRVWALQMNEEIIVSGSTSSAIRIWHPNVPGGDPRQLLGHTNEVRCLKFVGDTLVSGGYDSTVHVWRLSDGSSLRSMSAKTDVYGLHFDGERIATATRDGMVRLWDAESGQCIQSLVGHSGCLRTVQFDANRILSGGEDKALRIWDARNNECTAMLEAHTKGISTIQFDDDRIVSGSLDATAILWDPATLKPRTTFSSPAEEAKDDRYYYHSFLSIWQLQYDDKKLVTAHANAKAVVWDMASGEQLCSLQGHTGEIIALHFMGPRLVTGGEDCSIKVWHFSKTSHDAEPS